ncbi:hypothetical protein FACS1894193_06000 [Bacilli bacterium]|nr:hypothetical protein FACS1894192_07360 [Bacilli bacterium]GHU41719.1 hypothetical protein FACS1894193_06000 [Bacilli bacterium]
MKLWDFYSDLSEGKWDKSQIVVELLLGILKAVALFVAITVFFYLFAFMAFLGMIVLILMVISFVLYFVGFLSMF